MELEGQDTVTVPYLTAQQMAEVDRAMIEDYHIELIQMMENAGRCLATVARGYFLDNDPRGREVVVLAGTGGNGGGGMVCTRHLHNWGARVSLFITRPGIEIKGIPAHQLDILQRMKIVVTPADEQTTLPNADLIVDALVGYNLRGSPYGIVAHLIRAANAHGAPVLALDIPSGLEATTGKISDPTVRAKATLTLALPKEGLRAPGAAAFVGDLYLADIGVPPELYASPGLKLQVGPLFAEREVIKLGV
ncbi:MAG: NAD(P)H-hydrate epimerase [Chloroflexi bacterium]|nr:NAD(P)H-hydrate epimerase [Chloroflexota bacterium]